MNIGIIGAGRWGKNYIRTFMELGQSVKWICAREEAGLKDAVESTGVNAQTTTRYREVLADPAVEAVAVVTPGSTHYEMAKEAIKSGKHVLVEKPITLNSKEAEEIIKIAAGSKRVLMTGHLHRFNPAIRKIKHDLDAGMFGRIRYMHSIGTGNGPAREDMSALWDFGPHDVAITAYLIGSYPAEVSASGAAYLKKNVEDVFSMDMRFPGNIFATSFGSWLYPLKRRELIVVGEKLSAIYNDRTDLLEYCDGSKCREVKFDKAKPLTEQLRHFIDCIENGKNPEASGEDGLKVVRALEAAEKSMKNDAGFVRV